jgi:hypothetical protein
VKILNALAMLVPVLLASGLIVKYVPFLKNLSNQIIPLLNAAIAFLALFGGGAATAHASFLGDIGGFLSLPAKAMASILVSYLTSVLYDKVLKPILPPGAQPVPK